MTPPTPMTLKIEILNEEGVITSVVERPLEEVRNHFAFTKGSAHAFCLDDGFLYCHVDSGARLTTESLAACKALEGHTPESHLSLGRV